MRRHERSDGLMGGLFSSYRLVGYPVAGEYGGPLLVFNLGGECFLNVGQGRAPADVCSWPLHR